MPEATRIRAGSGAESEPDSPMESEAAPDGSRRRRKVPGRVLKPAEAGSGPLVPLLPRAGGRASTSRHGVERRGLLEAPSLRRSSGRARPVPRGTRPGRPRAWPPGGLVVRRDRRARGVGPVGRLAGQVSLGGG